MKLVSLAIVGKHCDQLMYIKDFQSTSARIPSSVNILPFDNLYEDYQALFGSSVSSTSSVDAENSSSAKRDFTIKQPSWDKCCLRHQFLLSEAAERLDDMIRSPQQSWWNPVIVTSGANDVMWMGLISVSHEYRVYGFVTTTKLKIIAAVEDDISENKQAVKAKEIVLKNLLSNIYSLYIEYLMNPFSQKNDKIVSPRFDRGLNQFVEAYNTSFMSVL